VNRENDPVLGIAGTWSQEFGSAFEAMSDERPAVDVLASPGIPDGARVWWKQPLDASPGSVVWIGAGIDTCTILGQRILTTAGIESADATESKETFLEVVRQSLGRFATAIGAQLAREVVCINGSEEEPPRDQTVGCEVTLNFSSGPLPSITFLLNKEMLEAVARTSSNAASTETQDPLPPLEVQQELSPRASSTLNLLMDVELPVSVSFGRTRVRVQEILKLITGSIIELDRSISEPVEVIVNNCVVARGEVVVIEGNYGVRITEVMSRQERLQESQRSLLPAQRTAARVGA
jgi:flagellar motor switch protein FliN/FliY